jgi:hypothetical protein
VIPVKDEQVPGLYDVAKGGCVLRDEDRVCGRCKLRENLGYKQPEKAQPQCKSQKEPESDNTEETQDQAHSSPKRIYKRGA